MKSIPLALAGHLDLDATSWTLLMKVVCKDGTILGFTTLDADLTYDDGGGDLVYSADQGFTPERIQATADLGVDNTDLEGWYSLDGVTEQRIRAGLFDKAEVWVYRVNFMDLSMGHEIWNYGTLGESRYSETGWTTEFRSLKQQLKQPLCQFYSLTCRARFGSKPIGTPGAEITERKPCNKEMTWVGGAVTSVSSARRVFTDSSRGEADGYFQPGVIRWLTGANAGAQIEVFGYAGKQFTLSLPVPYPIQPGDIYEVRQDCDNSLTMCKDRHDNILNFRGEPFVPVADADSLMVPGANISQVGG
ncbi:DUF2163 domain-containing protein [Lysobacter enzymogenes]|uniref:DUF2163 domain-containing protein n=1 Tax=Lysobacter enzymogenes TaxID=69 RepID=UPI001A96EAF0|nr:DUF2163 domain-containing protein [Lysobacter enzymogenes]QQP96485.1 DUF2163 domain-containing protein [Lysobacter enzymogenes]QQP96553.1 DUF2163 domain-containing protein [Lysobacter enzymogenes]